MAAPGEIEEFVPGLGKVVVPGDDPTTFHRYFFNVMADYAKDDVKLSAEALKAWEANRATGDVLGPRCAQQPPDNGHVADAEENRR
jgi:hypothetical protein